jgi:zinc transporter, ZIP family
MMFFYAALAGLTFSAGGVAGSAWRASPRLTSWLLHFAAGVVIAVLASELLPEIRSMKGTGALPVVVGFLGGACAMVLLGWATDKGKEGERGAHGLMTVIAIDALLDGLLIAIGFAGAARAAKLMAGGIATEMLPMGMSLAHALRQSGRSGMQAGLLCVGIGALPLVGAFLASSFIVRASPSVITGLLSFGAAALLYLVTEELLIEAHEQPQGRFDTALFFSGFAAVLFLDLGA